MRTIQIVLGCFALGVLAVALPAHAGSTAQVTVSNFQFTDQATGTPVTQVSVGDTVHWTWTSGTHTVTAGSASPDGTFASGAQSAGGTGYSFTVTAPGNYLYFCQIHAEMRGVILAQ